MVMLKDSKQAEITINAGSDMDMSQMYVLNVGNFKVQEGKVEERLIDDAARHVF
jgi:hypothetical protein